MLLNFNNLQIVKLLAWFCKLKQKFEGLKLDSEHSMMCQFKKQICLFFKEFFQIWVHFRRWLLNNNIDAF